MKSEFLPKEDSNFWKIWNCQYRPNQPDAPSFDDPVYLKNCRVAAAYFIDHYLFPVDGKRDGFKDAFRRMHTLMSHGLKGVGDKYESSAMKPDQFRYELGDELGFMFGTSVFAGAFQRAVKGRSLKPGDAIKLEVVFGEHFVGTSPEFKIEMDAAYRSENSYAIAIDTVSPPWEQRVFVNEEGRIRTTSFSNDRAPGNLDALEKLLAKILSFEPGEPPREFFETVAEFYQINIASHFFLRQNNSMAVNQTNCLLYFWAGKFITHTVRIDEKANAMTPAAFKKFFLFLLDNLPGFPIPLITKRGNS